MSLFSFNSKSKNDLPNGWSHLKSIEQLDDIIEASKTKPQLLFKHSIRCGISMSAQDALLSGWDIDPSKLDAWHLDLINLRSISNAIAEKTGVPHQSPQVIILDKGEVIFHKTHHAIRYSGVEAALK